MSTKKEDIYQLVLDHTLSSIATDNYDLLGIDALNISLDLKMDRANVSRILNRLYTEGRVIKIGGRPTLYVARLPIDDRTHGTFVPSYLPADVDWSQYLKLSYSSSDPFSNDPESEQNAFDCWLDDERSTMHYPILQAKSALFYPPRGMNAAIIGEPSTGKHTFANAMYHFAINQGLLPDKTTLHVIDCRNYAYMNHEDFVHAFIGDPLEETHSGLLMQARNSFIILRHLDALNEEKTRLLASIAQAQFIDSGKTKKHPFSARLVATLTDEHFVSANCLQSIFPMQIKMSALNDKNIDEMLVVVLQALSEEASTSTQTIRVSKGVLSCFVMSDYPGNLAHVFSEVKQACANAYFRSIGSESFFITIDFEDVSNEVLTSIHNINSRLNELNDYLNLFDNDYLYFSPTQKNKELQLLTELNKNMKLLESGPSNVSDDQIVDRCIHDIDYVNSIQLNTIRAILLKDLYDDLYPILRNASVNKNENLMYGLLLHLSGMIKQIKRGNTQTNLKMPEHSIAREEDDKTATTLSKIIEQKYEIHLPKEELSYIATYLYLSSQWVEKRYIQLLILSDNNENAKNYAEYLNSLNLRTPIHWLIVDLTNDPDTSLMRATEKINEIDKGKGVIIAADDKQVYSFSEQLKKHSNIPLTVVGDISPQSLMKIAKQAQTLDLRTNSKANNLMQSKPQTFDQKEPITNDQHAEELVAQITSKVLSESLVFLNPEKTSNALFHAFTGITRDLSLSYNDELMIKFLFHCSFMVERCIRKDVLNYPNTRQILHDNQKLRYIIEKNFNTIGEIFSITIPSAEMAMVMDIFIPYLNHHEA